ncbi:MAG: hypothetical protein NVS9B1_21950 [Candidatus Dormibacteraceae bacterium]
MSGQETRQLGEFAATAIPSETAIAAAGRAVGGAIDRARDAGAWDRMAPALAVAANVGSPEQSTVFGGGRRLGAAWAAFVNATASESAVVAAALATAEWQWLRVDAALSAIAIGLEAGHRVEAALATAPDRRAWPAGGVAAVIGAAAAAGRLLGLTPDQLAMALGLAATQSAGIVRQGSDAPSILHGRAAFDGVEAALLARDGYTAPTNGIEGRRGLAALTATGAKLDSITTGLGSEWRLRVGAESSIPATNQSVRELLGG